MRGRLLLLTLACLLMTGCAAVMAFFGYTSTSIDGQGPTNIWPNTGEAIASTSVTAAGIILHNLWRNFTRARELERRGLPKPAKAPRRSSAGASGHA